MMFSRILRPKSVVVSVVTIDPTLIRELGFKVALLDLDNTLAEDHVTHPTEYSREAIQYLKSLGLVCCIVSNAKSKRSADFAEELGIPCVSYANKPSTSGVVRALALTEHKPDEAVFIGDQIFTDIVAANRAGVYSILVERVTEEELFYIKLKRPFEKLVRRILHF
jgi:uncharacterized protein